MKIYVAIISTDVRQFAFADAKLDGLHAQIFGYVKNHWSELGDDWYIEHVRDRSDAVEIYFEEHIPMEVLYINETELRGLS